VKCLWGQCPNPLDPAVSLRHCPYHLARRRARKPWDRRGLYARRRAAVVCVDCGGTLAPGSVARCPAHLEAHRVGNRRRPDPAGVAWLASLELSAG